jgi:maltose O-acetyltransferase
MELLKKIRYKIVFLLYQLPRIIKYRLLSNCKTTGGRPVIIQPVQFCGKGEILFGKNVHIGCNPSPFLHNGYSYIEARNSFSKIVISNNVWINNNATLISEGDGIIIGENCIFGTNLEIYDTDFHDLNPLFRMTGTPKTKKVIIGDNVFAGSNVKILKGVSIGNNSIIGNGTIITKSIPENVIVCGSPCRIIKKI